MPGAPPYTPSSCSDASSCSCLSLRRSGSYEGSRGKVFPPAQSHLCGTRVNLSCDHNLTKIREEPLTSLHCSCYPLCVVEAEAAPDKRRCVPCGAGASQPPFTRRGCRAVDTCGINVKKQVILVSLHTCHKICTVNAVGPLADSTEPTEEDTIFVAWIWWQWRWQVWLWS